MTGVTTLRSTLTICRTCRPEGAAPDAEPAGAALGRATARAVSGLADAPVDVVAIACLSACGRACSATVAAPGKFSYVIGNLAPEDCDDLAAFALAHAASPDGIPPWRSRPEKIRKNTIARIAPPGVAHALVEPATTPEPAEDEA
ncbi:DUF1636 domain-containing protein [Methylopila sp. M107]|uniref:DUF1636 domain-containing protein n=1 Tax=Methylopila sp. M107 TaxID=1101190 RepID=UPI00037DC940|nr:DUF1636 domain-containing protein [Methylopila sp. M107]